MYVVVHVFSQDFAPGMVLQQLVQSCFHVCRMVQPADWHYAAVAGVLPDVAIFENEPAVFQNLVLFFGKSMTPRAGDPQKQLRGPLSHRKNLRIGSFRKNIWPPMER